MWKKISDEKVFLKPIDRRLIELVDLGNHYTAFGVFMFDKSIGIGEGFPDYWSNFSVVAVPGKKPYIERNCAIWDIVTILEREFDMKLSAGVGNGHQRQLLTHAPLCKALYKKEKGEWLVKLHPDYVKNAVGRFGL